MTRATGLVREWDTKRSNKYHAVKTYVPMLDRTFDSKGEAKRAFELKLMERGGLIKDLQFQVPFVLSQKPRIKVTLDFKYFDLEKHELVHEDYKGILTRDSRTRYAWLEQSQGIHVKITGREDR